MKWISNPLFKKSGAKSQGNIISTFYTFSHFTSYENAPKRDINE
jgi:hypothetical protein